MKLFTLEQANAMIPRLELAMVRMQQAALRLRRGIETAADETGCAVDLVDAEELLAHRPELRRAVEEIENMIAEIDGCGAQFKGLDLGLVDFPAEIDGKIGLLCWQFGEKEITHWHTLEDGFSGRQPLKGVTRTPYLQ